MLSDEFVAALGDPGRTEIAAARMHGDRHVGGLAFQRQIGYARIDCRQLVGIITARLRLLALLRITHHRPGGVVEGTDRLAPGLADIGEESIEIRINLLAHHGAPLTEMESAWRRNCHLRRDAAVRLEKLEVFEMRMAVEIDLAIDADSFMLGFDAV